MSLRRPLRRTVALATVATATIVALAMLPSTLAAQENNPNTTGLPLYQHVTTGSEYASLKTKTGTYRIYTAQSVDAIATVEAWYRHALPKAVESKFDDPPNHGIALTIGKDQVQIYKLDTAKATLIELKKYLGP
jgi:hypothetical protein